MVQKNNKLDYQLFGDDVIIEEDPKKNDFDFQNAIVPLNEIKAGGQPHDGIPATLDPKFELASKNKWLGPDDQILRILINGKAKAYPIKILDWHEAVNDQIEDKAFVGTFFPLCGNGMAFQVKLKESNLIFGISGLIYSGDVLLYDKQTESLWFQIESKAISGSMLNKELDLMT